MMLQSADVPIPQPSRSTARPLLATLPTPGIWLVVGLIATGCGCNSSPTPAPPPITETAPAAPPLFEDVTAHSGISFTYHNGEEAEQAAIIESMGGGVALLDYDGDGLLDVFLVGGGYYEGNQLRGHPCKLFRNLGGFRFQDVTHEAGLGDCVFFAHGAAAADYDRDGWPDLVVTGWGRPRLYHNEPNGKGGRRFVEVGQKAGFQEHYWATSAAWGDLDGDGFPELYLCQYGDWSLEKNHPECFAPSGPRDTCGPTRFKGLPHKLFRNNRKGGFTEISSSLGMKPDGRGMGVVMVDVNDDGKPDIYVANDTDPNFLYYNRSRAGDLRLEEQGTQAGVAYDATGAPNASMGVAAADYDGSGRASLFCTNFEGEFHALYLNESTVGREFFSYASNPAGLTALGRNWVGWGTNFVDVERRGWEDLFITNGHAVRYPGPRNQRQQLPVLVHNEKGRFVDVTPRGGSYFHQPHNGRGVGFGDLDNDGRIDLVINHLNEPVTVLRNIAGVGNHWLGIELVGKDRRDVVGSRVTLQGASRKLTRFAKSGESYLSSGDRRLTFGLGDSAMVGQVEVHWSWGATQTWPGLAADRYWRLIEGKALAEECRSPQ